MGIHFSLQHGFDEALGEGTYGLGEGFGSQRASRGLKVGNVLLDMVIERVGGLLTRISLGVRVHWMHPIDGLRLSHGHKISDALLNVTSMNRKVDAKGMLRVSNRYYALPVGKCRFA